MKKIIKLLNLIIAIIFIVISVTSCIPSSTLNQRALIQGISVDYENDKFIVTMQIYSSVNKKDDVTDTKNNIEIITAQGESIVKAFRNAEQINGKDIFQNQNNVILIGKSLVDFGIKHITTYFSSDYNVRSNVKIFVFDGRAGDLLSKKTENGYFSMTELENIALRAEDSGMISKTTVLDLKKAVDDESYGFILPVISIENDHNKEQILINETIVLNEFKNSQILNLNYSRSLLILNNKIKKLSYLLNDNSLNKNNQSEILIDLQNIKVSKKLNFISETKKYLITYNLTAMGNIVETIDENPSNNDFYFDLEKNLSYKLENQLNELIKFTQKNFKCDLLDVYKNIRQSNYNFYLSIKDNYTQYYCDDITFDINCKINIHRIGLEKAHGDY